MQQLRKVSELNEPPFQGETSDSKQSRSKQTRVKVNRFIHMGSLINTGRRRGYTTQGNRPIHLTPCQGRGKGVNGAGNWNLMDKWHNLRRVGGLEGEAGSSAALGEELRRPLTEVPIT